MSRFDDDAEGIARARRRILAHQVCWRRAGRMGYEEPPYCPCSRHHPLAKHDLGGTLSCPPAWDQPLPQAPDPLAPTRAAFRDLCGAPFWDMPR